MSVPGDASYQISHDQLLTLIALACAHVLAQERADDVAADKHLAASDRILTEINELAGRALEVLL